MGQLWRVLGAIKMCSLLVGTIFHTLEVPPGTSIGLPGPSLLYRAMRVPQQVMAPMVPCSLRRRLVIRTRSPTEKGFSSASSRLPPLIVAALTRQIRRMMSTSRASDSLMICYMDSSCSILREFNSAMISSRSLSCMEVAFDRIIIFLNTLIVLKPQARLFGHANFRLGWVISQCIQSDY